MAHVKVNSQCWLNTNEHSKQYVRHDGTVTPEITVPGFRLRMSLDAAESLAASLAEAVAFAKKQLTAKGGLEIKQWEQIGDSSSFKVYGDGWWADVDIWEEKGKLRGKVQAFGDMPGNVYPESDELIVEAAIREIVGKG